jgi:hypothetical protein
MSIDPFTTPAEAEREARVKQAHDFLALAAGVSHFATCNSDTDRPIYEDGVQAVRDALVGQGHAMLAVRDELADIAASLRTLTALPSAAQYLAEQVTTGLEEIGNDVCDVHTAIEDGVAATTDAIRDHAETVNDGLGNVAEVIDRVRWWQWRRRWTARRQGKALDARIAAAQDSLLVKLDDSFDVEAGLADVYERAGRLEREHDGEFRVDLRRSADQPEEKPLASSRFRAEEWTPWETAHRTLPRLCELAGVAADPAQVYGQLFACNQDGVALWFIDTVFLPGATVHKTTDPM